jgi:hypothetical protein
VRPAPKLKVDKLLGILNRRRLTRRVRVRILRRLTQRDYGADNTKFGAAFIVKCDALLRRNDIEGVVALRRRAAAAAAAGSAAATVSASLGGGRAGLLTTLAHAGENIGEQVLASAEDQATAAIEEYLGAPDVDGSLDVDGVRGTSAVLDGAAAAARAASGLLRDGEGAALGAALRADARNEAKGCLAMFARLGEQAMRMVSPGQLKIVLGNLQINASLTVVFAIPWPPVYTRVLNFLSVFKLDVFKGLAFAVPCLHSNHFMSLAAFVATPIVLVLVLALAFGAVALASIVPRRCCGRNARRVLHKLQMCKCTPASAGTATVKVAVTVLLFIYPTICSKVFMTFKCVEAGGASYMVADMAYTCYEGEWLFWAAVSGVAMAVCAFVWLIMKAPSRTHVHSPSRVSPSRLLTLTRARAASREHCQMSLGFPWR